MALPRKLKRLNVFLNGENWVGEAEDFTPAKLTRKFEALSRRRHGRRRQHRHGIR